MIESRVHKLLADLDRIKWDVTYKGIIVGLIAGLLVTVYRLAIEFGTDRAVEAYRFLRENTSYIPFWILLIFLVSYVSYRLMKFEPFAKGSGIPQVEGIVILGMKMKWHTILLVRYIVGFITSFFGLSVGREGPSIQIGAAGAQALAENTGKNKLEENYLITAGASAGLSAAFNAPLSGIMFALEEVHRTFSPNILIAATTAALTADVVSKYFFGLTPVLSYVNVPQLPMKYYFWLLVMGVISGIIGSIVNKGLLGVSVLYEKLPALYRPLIALLIALPVGLFLPQVLGGGQNLIKLSENAKIGIALLLVYLIVKFLFTCFSFGSGIPGGIFMPILSIGALTGSIFGQLMTNFGLPIEYIPAFCICAMAGVMSASVKAPVTSILLMAEMAGSLIHLLPVATVAFVALLTSDLLKISPIYEVLLERMTGEKEVRVKKKSGAIIEVPVELGSEVAGKKVKEIKWPDGILIVGLNRGNKEFVPNGNTKIIQGDYLIILSSDQKFEEINKSIIDLCRPH